MQKLSPFSTESISHRGFTLVELMIVVAIIGVLAALAIVSYSAWIDRAHMAELEGYVLEVENAQKSYYSRNHEYFDIAEETNSTDYDPEDPFWTQVLEFDHELPPEITISTDSGDSCDICDGGPDPSAEADIWYAVRGEHDELDFDVFTSSELDGTIEIGSQ